jgi:hypothetical protein
LRWLATGSWYEAALALAKYAFCFFKAVLLFFNPVKRRLVPPVQSMVTSE